MTEAVLTPREVNEEAGPFSLFDRMWDDWFGRRMTQPRVLRPAVDIAEDEQAFHFALDLPGLKKEDVKITVEDGVLTVSGEVRLDDRRKDRTWHRIERFYGAFHRSLTLPSAVDVDAAEATFADGVLHIRLPKTEEAKPKTLRIK